VLVVGEVIQVRDALLAAMAHDAVTDEVKYGRQ